MKTCSLGLFKKLRPVDLQNMKREWLMTASDVAMMFPLIEMAGINRIRHVPELIYEYNDTNPHNDHKVNGEEQKAVEAWLRKKDQKKRLVTL